MRGSCFAGRGSGLRRSILRGSGFAGHGSGFTHRGVDPGGVDGGGVVTGFSQKTTTSSECTQFSAPTPSVH